MIRRVLLTGATGLIGKEAIVPLLKNGFEVYAVSSREAPPWPPGVHGISEDILFRGGPEKIVSVVRPTHLLHFAWETKSGYLSSPLNCQWLESSLELLRQFHSYGGKRAVFSGTCFEYMFGNTPLREEDATSPSSLYARCKHLLHHQAEQYALQNGVLFSWGRIFYVFGKREHPGRLMPHVLDALAHDKPVIINAGSLVRDYMYAPDVASAFVSLLCSDVSGTVNVCSGQGVTIENFVLAMAKRAGKAHLVVNANTPHDQPPFIVGDNTRLLKETGYRYGYTLNSAFEEVYNSLRKC